jgi:protein-S-isoprenylcysteine O-methyltransferase Ste14
MNALELKIPPPLVFLLLAVAMAFLPDVAGVVAAPLGVRIAAGVALACIGQAISISGMSAFRRARTTINPLKPGAASALVQSGIYRHTRNPMYLGLLLSLAGWAAFLSHALPLLALPLFVGYITRFQIEPEERILASMFGTQYADYRRRVRRWV